MRIRDILESFADAASGNVVTSDPVQVPVAKPGPGGPAR